MHKSMLLHYQPVIDRRTGECFALEALARQEQDDGSLTSPAMEILSGGDEGKRRDFIFHTLDILFEDIKRFSEHGINHKFSFNVGIEQIDHDFVTSLSQLANDNAIALSLIILEVTEHSSSYITPTQLVRLNGLRKQGLAIAMDDYGSGFSDTRRMEQLPIDIIKIDREHLVEAADPIKRAKLKSLVKRWHHERKHVIAEGIDCPELLETTSHIDCHLVQGFHFARPMSPDQLIAWHNDVAPVPS